MALEVVSTDLKEPKGLEPDVRKVRVDNLATLGSYTHYIQSLV